MLNQKTIKLLNIIEVKVLKLNFKTFLLIKNPIKTVYLLVPKGLLIQKNNQTLILQYNNNKTNKHLLGNFTFFYSKLLNFNSEFEKVHTKKLVLKGLGLKATFINESLIEFKLGLSHMIQVSIPNSIKVSIIKNTLILESCDNILLGNFSATIKNFKTPDSYKGKGICYKNEILFLKAVKKT